MEWKLQAFFCKSKIKKGRKKWCLYYLEIFKKISTRVRWKNCAYRDYNFSLWVTTFYSNWQKPISSCQNRAPSLEKYPNSAFKGAYSDKIKSFFCQLKKTGYTWRKTVKTAYFTHYISNLNPEGGVFRFKTSWIMTI